MRGWALVFFCLGPTFYCPPGQHSRCGLGPHVETTPCPVTPLSRRQAGAPAPCFHGCNYICCKVWGSRHCPDPGMCALLCWRDLVGVHRQKKRRTGASG